MTNKEVMNFDETFNSIALTLYCDMEGKPIIILRASNRTALLQHHDYN